MNAHPLELRIHCWMSPCIGWIESLMTARQTVDGSLRPSMYALYVKLGGSPNRAHTPSNRSCGLAYTSRPVACSIVTSEHYEGLPCELDRNGPRATPCSSCTRKPRSACLGHVATL